jgi:hypothetical protein
MPVAVPGSADAAPVASSDPLGEPLGVRGVAHLIGCSPWTVRHVLMPRGLPHFRANHHGKVIFYRNQVVRWVLHREQEGGRIR